jgi:hypothetical protein
MNVRQSAFFRQAQSDWAVFRHFHPTTVGWRKRCQAWWCNLVGVRPFSFSPCHELHYLQMCTEKLGKAYYPAAIPRGHHAAFRRFLTDILVNPKVITPLGFPNLAALTLWQGSSWPLIEAIEDLAPAIADRKHLPNPEYPWPKGAEAHAPADYSFHAEVYALLDTQANSGQPPFLNVLDRMVDTMRTAAWHL